MPGQIDTETTRAMAEAGAQLVEVLPEEAYRREHLPGAVSLPLAEIARAPKVLDTTRPVIAYCHGHQCDLSPRAAAHLELLGFLDVYDYVDGKVAWLGEGLPSEGIIDDGERVGSVARRDVPRVGPDALVDNAVRAADGPWEVVVVVNDEDIVLGLVRVERVADGGVGVRSVMEMAPSTVRPSVTRPELAKNMDNDGQRFVLVTTLSGRLIGLVHRDDLDDLVS